jgi:hypothetical protein
LRRETTMTLAWIAERLQMGARRIWHICSTGTGEGARKRHDTID